VEFLLTIWARNQEEIGLSYRPACYISGEIDSWAPQSFTNMGSDSYCIQCLASLAEKEEGVARVNGLKGGGQGMHPPSSQARPKITSSLNVSKIVGIFSLSTFQSVGAWDSRYN
jgi:hypothetical protein